MTRGGLGAVSFVVLMTTACSHGGNLAIRSIGNEHVAQRPATDSLALAKGELAIGNVGLALENYRKAARTGASSAEALAGIGACYDQMGRFDLSRQAYERALAIAPGDAVLYGALAASLDAQGLNEEAKAVRREAADARAALAAATMTAAGSLAILPAPVMANPDGPSAPAGSSITVMLPPARPATAQPAGRLARLERLSSGEVALLTSETSPWAAKAVARTSRSVTVRFEPRETLLVLNGARIAGIAARTRQYLAARGFPRSRIGDAPMPTTRTIIRYVPAERARALRIAAQFPHATPVPASSGVLTLIVGRDAPAIVIRHG